MKVSRNLFLQLIIFFFLGLVSQACSKKDSDNSIQLASPLIVVSNTVPTLEEEVTFYYQSDISGTPTWDFGDGTQSTEAKITRTFEKEGKYTVNLSLSDGAGGIEKATVEILVAGKSLSKSLKELAKNTNKVWVCAHRANTYQGLKVNKIPENSIPAIEKAIELGIEMIEIDVRTTNDGELVILHDATLNRTTNGTGPVDAKNLVAIKQYRLKDEQGTLTNYQLPTLEEALLAGRGKIFYNLDLGGKTFNIPKLVKLVSDLNMLDRVTFYVGSDLDFGKQISDVARAALVFPWVSNNGNIDSWIINSKVSLLQLAYKGTTGKALIAYGHTKGLPSFSNALLDDGDNAIITQNNYVAIDEMLTNKLQVIQTDYGDKINQYLTGKGAK